MFHARFFIFHKLWYQGCGVCVEVGLKSRESMVLSFWESKVESVKSYRLQLFIFCSLSCWSVPLDLFIYTKRLCLNKQTFGFVKSALCSGLLFMYISTCSHILPALVLTVCVQKCFLKTRPGDHSNDISFLWFLKHGELGYFTWMIWWSRLKINKLRSSV